MTRGMKIRVAACAGLPLGVVIAIFAVAYANSWLAVLGGTIFGAAYVVVVMAMFTSNSAR